MLLGGTVSGCGCRSLGSALSDLGLLPACARVNAILTNVGLGAHPTRPLRVLTSTPRNEDSRN